MTFNKKELLAKLSNAPIGNGEEFYEEKNDKFMESVDFKFFKEYYFDNGATKAVIIPKEGDFVIKIPYSGFFSSDFDDDEEEYYNDFLPFEGADGDQPWNYCEAELKRYNFAKEFGFEKYLAKVEFLGYVNDYPVYIQEKCKMGMAGHYHSKEERQKTSNLCKVSLCIDLNWLTDFRICYGEEELLRFITFISNNDWNDLFSANVGYLNDKPVLVDFAGYNN